MRRATAAVLVGGRATRMDGRNKVLIKVGGVPLIERVVMVLTPLVARVVIVADDPAPYRYLGLDTIPDAVSGAGAPAGLLAGLERAGETVLACAGDLPFPNSALAEYLLDVLPGWDAVVPRCLEGRQPLFAVYAPACVDAVRRVVAGGDQRMTSVYDGLAVRYVEGPELAPFDPGRSFFDVNRPADLTVARRMSGRVAISRRPGI